MKSLGIGLLSLVFIALGIINLNIVNASMPLNGHIIVIDPGHGGLDPGTISGKLYEKDLNLSISLLLEKELIRNGASVILTRDSDYDLSSPNVSWRKKSDFDNRIKLINDSKADLYISIHLNYLQDKSYYGPQVFYNKENRNLANTIQNEMNKELKGTREIKSIPKETYMYGKILIPGVLIECGFLSNNNEANNLKNKTYQSKIAFAITKGIIMYFS